MLCSKSTKHKRVYSLLDFFINLFTILMQLFIYQFIHLDSSIYSIYLFDSLIYFKYEECINAWWIFPWLGLKYIPDYGMKLCKISFRVIAD